MKMYAHLVVAGAAIVVGAGVLKAGGETETIKKDQKQMAGTWRVISYEKDGKQATAEQLEKTRSIFSADGKAMVQREGKTIAQGSIKIDPTKKPKQSETTYTEGELKGKTVLGIYEIDGDSMKICFSLPGKDLPTEFSSKPGSGHVLITYKRDGPPKDFTNSIGMKFVWIPPGNFMMGSPKEEKDRKANEAQHKVTLTKGYYMGVHFVTQEQWEELMGNNPSGFRRGEKNLPIDTVSWEDCQGFIKKLRERDKKLYRLPSEAEWEYSCRAGTKTPFHFGETISTNQANYNGAGFDGMKGLARRKTTPVGGFPANAWGLYDMHGNLWQWCQDWYGDYPQKDVVDPKGPEKGKLHVLRGGSWFEPPEFCRSAIRNTIDPGRNFYVGFRLCFYVE